MRRTHRYLPPPADPEKREQRLEELHQRWGVAAHFLGRTKW